MKSLIIGYGQVGSAIYDVINKHHETFIRDIESIEVDNVEILHVCYPEHQFFPNTTMNYIKKYRPRLTIIHSSVKVGTTDKCGDHVVYSPVRGRHPKLASDLGIYTKFIFGRNEADRNLAGDYFEKCGLEMVLQSDPRAGELLKVISNVHMGVEIAWRQEVERMLEKFDISAHIYEEWEKTYRNGYLKSGDIDLARPIMRPDPIGGHCILPCTDILLKQFPSKILEFVKESNDEIKNKGKVLNGTCRH